MTNEERQARGQKYVLLRLEADELFDAVRTILLETIESTSPNDAASILEMHRGLQNLSKVREAIKLVIMDGQSADAAIRAAQLHRG
jgi:hypothetical protein